MMDEDFIKNLAKVLDYGYKQQFDIQMPLKNEEDYHLFSSTLNRDMLRENEQTIIKRYSRESEKEFTIFGITTQTSNTKTDESKFKDAIQKMGQEDESMVLRTALTNVVLQLGNLENTFSGKLTQEIIIEPIAVYREI
jgi:hypothetical protein